MDNDMDTKMIDKVVTGIIMVIVLAIMLTSCEPSDVGKDNYRFDRKEYEILQPEVTFVLASSPSEWKEYRERFDLDDGFNAFSVTEHLTDGSKRCTIYVPDPEWKWRPELIGHEVAHCIWGKWHIDADPD